MPGKSTAFRGPLPNRRTNCLGKKTCNKRNLRKRSTKAPRKVGDLPGMASLVLGSNIHFVPTLALEQPSPLVKAREGAMVASHLEEKPEAMAAKGEEKVSQRLWQPHLHRPTHRVLLNHGDSRDVSMVLESPKAGPPLTPFFYNLRAKMAFWMTHGSMEVQNLIRSGVRSDRPLPSTLSRRETRRSAEQIQLAKEVLKEYLEVGAIKQIPETQARHLIPWFVIQKTEGEKTKLRLISDCRELNQYFCPRHFRLDHWSTIFPMLRKGMWAAKIDLKNAYFHLALEKIFALMYA